MLQDADLAGNAYVWDAGEQLVRLRPDWVTIVSEQFADPLGRLYRKVIGYYYEPPVTAQPFEGPPKYFAVDEVAHWSPNPDPAASFRGMSWLTPVLREVWADQAMTDYKISYLTNAASPNLLIKYQQKLGPDSLLSIADRVQARHGGVDNAFRTLVLDEGADVTTIGNSFEQMNFSTVQAAGENRILIASGVPGIVIGSKEGLMAATYSNYEQAMRRFADVTMRPLWRSVCACLSQLVAVPQGSRLWFDTSDIAALRQGEKERADTLLVQAQSISEFVKFGFDPMSAVAAIESNNLALLAHPGPPLQIMTEVPKASPPAAVLPVGWSGHGEGYRAGGEADQWNSEGGVRWLTNFCPRGRASVAMRLRICISVRTVRAVWSRRMRRCSTRAPRSWTRTATTSSRWRGDRSTGRFSTRDCGSVCCSTTA
jgi:hypothetical protein